MFQEEINKKHFLLPTLVVVKFSQEDIVLSGSNLLFPDIKKEGVNEYETHINLK